ncbi:MAG TPA: type VI secretion system baseplate subunit TssG [Bacteroidota bacterium]
MPEKAVPEKRAPRGVTARLFREGYLFDFFQAVRLLETYFTEGKTPGGSGDLAAERIRFHPHPGLAFPATDVRSVELEQGPPEQAVVTATFMGLYGVDSPLPPYFYDMIAGGADESLVLRSFLDIFNNRLYALFYRSWKKYRPGVLYGTGGTRQQFVGRALSLAGLGTSGAVDAAPLPPLRFAAFAGLLSARMRNGEGLRNMLEGLLEGIRVSVRENVRRWVPIPERSRLGRKKTGRATLGENACIGEGVDDISGKFRLVLGPLTFGQYLELLPGGSLARILHYVVRLYVRDTLDYDLQLNVRTREIPLLKLGDRPVKLGQTTWLANRPGRPAAEMTSRIVAYS